MNNRISATEKNYPAIWTSFLGLFGISLLVGACGGSSGGGAACDDDNDCTPQICDNGACVSPPSDSGDTSSDTLIDSGDSESDVDTDSTSDDTDTGETPFDDRSVRDYVLCDDDGDCPDGMGHCLTRVTLNNMDPLSGKDYVNISQIFSGLSKAGVCSESCTVDASSCSKLSITDFRGQAIPFVCQLVTSLASPYPANPGAFPFDDQLDSDSMAAGVVFGAICRPPFELHPDIPSTFCSECAESEECEGGLCWAFGENREPEGRETGLCLMACDSADSCPVGFNCSEIAGVGTYCRPDEETCDGCRDLDGDGYGTGHCDPLSGGVTPVDCDDKNVLAYFDPGNTPHAFPDHCGAFDFNCNGLADDDEIVSGILYPEDHCGACFAGCTGSFAGDSDFGGATHTCEEIAGTPQCVVTCDDPDRYTDCDGALSNGCEVLVQDRTRYRDLDGDGTGDLSTALFSCEDELPVGWVLNGDDCDDGNVATEGTFCDTGDEGICAPGRWKCVDAIGSTHLECSPEATAETMDLCNGQDDDCDGDLDEDAITSACMLPLEKGACQQGTNSCVDGTMRCVSVGPEAETAGDGYDADCDGFDGTLATAVFLAPGWGNGGSGTMADPFTNLHLALNAATARNADIYAAEGIIENDASAVIPDGVSIYGGYRRYAAELWSLEIVNGTSARRTSILAPAHDPANPDNVIALDLLNIVSETWLKNINLYMSPAQNPGVSLYGLRCDRCDALRLQNVSVFMANASNGADYGGTGENGQQAYFDTLQRLWRARSGSYPNSGEAGGSSIGMMFFNSTRTLFVADVNGVPGASNVQIFAAAAGNGGYNNAAGGDSIGVLYSGNITRDAFAISINNGVAGSGSGTGSVGRKKDWHSFSRCVVYVNDDATGNGSGDSWGNAMRDLNAAIAKARTGNSENSTCDVWVAAGRYTPGTTRDSTFAMYFGVNLYGGFTATGTSIAGRRNMHSANASILSGDLLGDDIPGAFGVKRIDNVYNVVRTANGAVLDGFVISGGQADHATTFDKQRGGGLTGISVSPTIRNSVIRDNYAIGNGGGIYNYNGPGRMQIENCVISGNRSGLNGGALATESASADLVHVSIVDNTAVSDVGSVIYSILGNIDVTSAVIWGGNGTQVEGSGVTISYSNTEGGIFAGDGNISADPLFVDRFGADFHLQDGSPCIDSGDWAVTRLLEISADLAGNARFVGDQVDMGAFENAAAFDTPPQLQQTMIETRNGIILSFDQPLDPLQGVRLANYSIDNGLAIESVGMSANLKDVTLTLSGPMTFCEDYVVTISPDVIDAHGISVGATASSAFTLDSFVDRFDDGVSDDWTVVNEGEIGSTGWGVWAWEELWGNTYNQASDDDIMSVETWFPRRGTYTYWMDATTAPFMDGLFRVNVLSKKTAGLGVLFRFVDSRNYYKLELDQDSDFVRLSVMNDGQEYELALLQGDETETYLSDVWFELSVEMNGDEFTIYQDGAVIIGPVTSGSHTSGTVGLYTWGNTVLFDDVEINLTCP